MADGPVGPAGHPLRALAGVAAATGVAVLAGAVRRPPTPGQWSRLATLDPQAALLAAIRGAALGCLLWLWLVMAAGLLGSLPGDLGRAGRAGARRLVPPALRPLLGAILGTALAITGAVGGGAAVASSSGPGPAWLSPAPWTPPAAPLPVVAPWPTTPEPVLPAVTLDRPVSSSQPAPAPGPRCPPAVITVVPGDTLWGLTAAALGGADAPAVARSWPRLWQANRAVVGGDPDLIRPGQRLTIPAELLRPQLPPRQPVGGSPCPAP